MEQPGWERVLPLHSSISCEAGEAARFIFPAKIMQFRGNFSPSQPVFSWGTAGQLDGTSSQKAPEMPAQVMSFIFRVRGAGGACFLLAARDVRPKMSLLMAFTVPDVIGTHGRNVRCATSYARCTK